MSKEGLGAVLLQKQEDGFYHPIAFSSRTLIPSEQNYHSSKLEFLVLKWSVTEHFKEYLAYMPFTVCTDNNSLIYVLTTPNLDTTGHHWVGALTSYNFTLEYQKGSDNATADALSRVPVRYDRNTIQSLLEGVVTSTTQRERVEHDCLSDKSHAHTLKLAPMHVTNWEEAQGEDMLLATCCKWMGTKKDVPLQKRDALLKTCMGKHSDSDEGKGAFSCQEQFHHEEGNAVHEHNI